MNLGRQLRAVCALSLIVSALIVTAAFTMWPVAITLACLSLSSPLTPRSAGAIARVRLAALRGYRWWCSFCIALFLAQVAAALELVYGISFALYGDAFDIDVDALVIANHRTRLDWAMFWPFLVRSGFAHGVSSAQPSGGIAALISGIKGALTALSRYHVVLKGDMKAIPFAGWAIQMGRFLFLARRWEEDEVHMARMLALLRAGSLAEVIDGQAVPANNDVAGSAGDAPTAISGAAASAGPSTASPAPFHLLFFPEGTDLAVVNRDRSRTFASNHGLRDYDYVLHPRTRGFAHTVALLREQLLVQQVGGSTLPIVSVARAGAPSAAHGAGAIDPGVATTPTATMVPSKPIACLYDLTIGYSGPIPQTEKSLLTGQTPTTVHILVSSTRATALPASQSGLEQFVVDRFLEKEECLKDFYSNGCSRLKKADIVIHRPGTPQAKALSRQPQTPGSPTIEILRPQSDQVKLSPSQMMRLPSPLPFYIVALLFHFLTLTAVVTLGIRYPALVISCFVTYLTFWIFLVPVKIPKPKRPGASGAGDAASAAVGGASSPLSPTTASSAAANADAAHSSPTVTGLISLWNGGLDMAELRACLRIGSR